MKRMRIDFSSGNILRLSAAGVDVDTAQPHELLLHESVLYGQVVQTGFITNPKTPGALEWFGSTSILDQGYIPSCVFWPKHNGVDLSYPNTWVYGNPGFPPIIEIDVAVTQTTITAEFYIGWVDALGYAVLRQPA